ncbi:MAG: hypothetical protein PHQ23_02970 [Candidatus Wallbacteria bacterium]|nr:hypothetical protein [Candidatus Wallbacteria bacterium]
MLVPDNIHPEKTVYYNGSFVLDVMREHKKLDLLDLYAEVVKKREMTMPVLLLCLDWLFLLDLITMSGSRVELCS